jgi:2-keto-4-pentenoate hydratase/2-oxohepta-3-ene-1,7-dioic acid hydratase in catechol pathway
MHLATFLNSEGIPHIGVVQGEQIIDIGNNPGRLAGMYSTGRPGFDMIDFILEAEKNWAGVHALLALESYDLQNSGAILRLNLHTLQAPIPRPLKNVFCLGRNYAEHATESRRAFGEAPPAQEIPQYPMFFTKAPTAVAGPYTHLALDYLVTTQYDWEVELAVVIGKRGKNIRRAEAMDYVFGYTVLNDISARDVQNRHGGQYFKGKSLDNTCPIGPWIVTCDEIEDPHNLQLYTRVNGIEKQNANTRDMIFDIPAIIESLSQGLTLEPGDIIATGTPAGIGHARTPAEYLRPGDVVECEIEKIGVIRNRIIGENSGQEGPASR